jgi:hypothetical protein
MTTTAPVDLRCRVCGIVTTLSPDPTVRMAEVQVFCAAHNTHEEGIGVEIVIQDAQSPAAG